MGTNGNSSHEDQGDVNLPMAVMSEQTLAVDLARAEIDTAIATAHKYPRSLDTVIKKIATMSCYNDAAAENCIYSLPRGGKPIIGPSIGFANIVAAAWGNCTDAARIVAIDRKDKVVVAEGGFHDLETNRKTMLPVQRRIVDRQGRLFSDDMIMVTGMAAASIARRNAILNAVPRALWFPIYEQALQIVRGDVETFAERKDKALKAFAQFGVKPEQVYMALGLKGDPDMTLEHIAPMRGMYSALRDGSVSVEEMFDPRRMTGTAFETVTNPLGDEDPPKEVVDKQTGEITAAPAEKKKRGRGPSKKKPEAVTPAEHVAGAIEKAGIPLATPDNRVSPADLEKTVAGPQVQSESFARPKTAEAYKGHLAAWLSFYATAGKIEERWRAERDLRGACMVTEDHFAECQGMKNQRIAEVQA
jgi:hypothetical protein